METGRSGDSPERRKVRLYIVEEQDLLREAYKAVLLSEPDLEIAGISGDTGIENIMRVLSIIPPDVVLLGTKTLQPGTITQLGTIRERFPDLGIVLLFALYDIRAIKQLREFARGVSMGCAFLQKHSVDTVHQLTQVVHAVAEGQIILDPTVMEWVVSANQTTTFLKELTHREWEVLSWMAKGYRNATIAEILLVDPKTVERHINSIYSKLNLEADSKHPRVVSVTEYLKATGQLPTESL